MQVRIKGKETMKTISISILLVFFVPFTFIYAIIAKSCPNDSEKTGQKYYVNSPSSYPIRSGPSKDAAKLINDKTANMGIPEEFKYRNIDSSTIVYEECKKDGWSLIKIITPSWLSQSHQGWVESKILVSTDGSDKYKPKIPDYVLEPYDKINYPKLYAQFSSKLPEIEKLRQQAARIAADSEQCDVVTDSQLTLQSTLKSLSIRVDCSYEGANKRFIYTEEDIKNYQSEKITYP
jgi:hypothetical protein